MKRNILIAVGIFTAFTVCFAAISPTTGLQTETAWQELLKKIDKSNTQRDTFLNGLGGVRHVQVALAAADINGAYATPVLVIAAPGTAKAIAIVKVEFTIVRTATAFANGGAAIIQYDSTTHGGGLQACDSTLASTVITGAAGTSISLRNGAIVSDSTATIVNKGIYFSNATGAFDTGTGTATLDVWYVVIP